jgi:hypothetical protein
MEVGAETEVPKQLYCIKRGEPIIELFKNFSFEQLLLKNSKMPCILQDLGDNP